MPIEFELTEQQQQAKRMVREFAEAEIKPRVMEWDEAQHFPKDLFTKMGALGLIGVISRKSMAAREWATLSTRRLSKSSRA